MCKVNPEVYICKTGLQREQIDIVLKEYQPKLNWKYDETKSLLGIGSGPGDVTANILEKICSKITKNLWVLILMIQYWNIRGKTFSGIIFLMKNEYREWNAT